MFRSAIAASCCWLAACSDTLAPDDFVGKPKFSTQFTLVQMDQTPEALRIGLFWNPKGREAIASFEELVEQPANGLTREQALAGGEWHFYEAPSDAHLAKAASGAKFGVGVPVAYEDTNGNGRRDAGEKIVANAPVATLLYAPEPVSAADSPTGFALPAGFRVAFRPFTCAPSQAPANEDTCTVPLGGACENDAACGTGGACLSNGPWPWPAGYCVIRETTETPCRPKDGRLLRNHRDANEAWWVKACTSDADCGRDTYQCDYAKGACLPTTHILVRAEPEPKLPVFCPRPPGAGSQP